MFPVSLLSSSPAMSNSFREAIEEDFGLVFLDDTHFAEEVTFLPGGGGPGRPLVALVSASARTVVEERGEYRLEELVVRVSDDLHHAKGGIDQPQNGDRIVRANDELAYAWTGEVRVHQAGEWVLIYERRKVTTMGGPGRAR